MVDRSPLDDIFHDPSDKGQQSNSLDDMFSSPLDDILGDAPMNGANDTSALDGLFQDEDPVLSQEVVDESEPELELQEYLAAPDTQNEMNKAPKAVAENPSEEIDQLNEHMSQMMDMLSNLQRRLDDLEHGAPAQSVGASASGPLALGAGSDEEIARAEAAERARQSGEAERYEQEQQEASRLAAERRDRERQAMLDRFKEAHALRESERQELEQKQALARERENEVAIAMEKLQNGEDLSEAELALLDDIDHELMQENVVVKQPGGVAIQELPLEIATQGDPEVIMDLDPEPVMVDPEPVMAEPMDEPIMVDPIDEELAAPIEQAEPPQELPSEQSPLQGSELDALFGNNIPQPPVAQGPVVSIPQSPSSDGPAKLDFRSKLQKIGNDSSPEAPVVKQEPAAEQEVPLNEQELSDIFDEPDAGVPDPTPTAPPMSNDELDSLFDSDPVEIGNQVPNYEQPIPTHTPAPVYEQPTPVYEQPTPAYEQPTPVYEQPTPAYEQPTPVYEQPAPAYEQPTPVYEQPAPVYEQPAPAYEQPAPTYQPPAQEPVYNQQPNYPPVQDMTPVPAAHDRAQMQQNQQMGGQLPPAQDVLWAASTPVKSTAKLAEGQAMTRIREGAASAIVTETKKTQRVKQHALQWDRLQPGNPPVISITSPKGGSGKSSTAMNMAAWMANNAMLWAEDAKKSRSNVRVPRILVFDGDIGGGTLAIRVAGVEEPNVINLVNNMDAGFVPNTFEDLKPYIIPHREYPNLNILAAPADPDAVEDLMTEDYGNLMNILRKFFDVIIIDTGIEMYANFNQFWARSAHVMYVLTLPENVNLRKTAKFIEYVTTTREGRESGQVRPPLVTRDRINLIIMRSDADWGIRDVPKTVADFFEDMPSSHIFYFHDVDRAIIKTNNAGDFLALKPGLPGGKVYAADIATIVQDSFKRFLKVTR